MKTDFHLVDWAMVRLFEIGWFIKTRVLQLSRSDPAQRMPSKSDDRLEQAIIYRDIIRRLAA